MFNNFVHDLNEFNKFNLKKKIKKISTKKLKIERNRSFNNNFFNFEEENMVKINNKIKFKKLNLKNNSEENSIKVFSISPLPQKTENENDIEENLNLSILNTLVTPVFHKKYLNMNSENQKRNNNYKFDFNEKNRQIDVNEKKTNI